MRNTGMPDLDICAIIGAGMKLMQSTRPSPHMRRRFHQKQNIAVFCAPPFPRKSRGIL